MRSAEDFATVMIHFPKEILVTKLDPSFYSQIKEILLSARNKVYATANFAMVEAYWHIGKSIVEKQGGEVRAEYGTRLIAELSAKMTLDFGKGFTVANLQNMRLFYLTFQNFYTLCSKLSWSHYRLLMRVESEQARQFYLEECAKAGWSVRQLVNGRFIVFFMKDCYPVRISAKFRRRFRERHQQNNQKILSVIHMFWNFLVLNRLHLFLKKIWSRRSLIISRKFLLELGRGFSLLQDKKDLRLMEDIFILTLCFIIIF